MKSRVQWTGQETDVPPFTNEGDEVTETLSALLQPT